MKKKILALVFFIVLLSGCANGSYPFYEDDNADVRSDLADIAEDKEYIDDYNSVMDDQYEEERKAQLGQEAIESAWATKETEEQGLIDITQGSYRFIPMMEGYLDYRSFFASDDGLKAEVDKMARDMDKSDYIWWESYIVPNSFSFAKISNYYAGLATNMGFEVIKSSFNEIKGGGIIFESVDEVITVLITPNANKNKDTTIFVIYQMKQTNNQTADRNKGNCTIKGNIAFDSGEKIYHLPGQLYYNETLINPDYGERWFCSEVEAEGAGWRKARE